MAKKVEIKKKSGSVSGKSTAFVLPELHSNGWLFLRDFRFQAIAIVLITILFYGSTYKNRYALDDDIIMKQNMYVQKGISGIPEILGNDAYKSYYQSMGVEQQLSGGRYRPLSIVTFAIEQSIFGECYGERYTEVRDSLFDLQRKGISNEVTGHLITEKNALDVKIKNTNMDIAGIRHLFQVFWFILALLVLLWLFREHIFRSNTDIAFLTVLLFAIHPIHTEVVANVKSRDEIFSLLFIGLTFIFFFRYDLKKVKKDLYWAMAFFFLALLSKEYAVVVPFLLVPGVIIFHKRKFSEIVPVLLCCLGFIPAIIYLLSKPSDGFMLVLIYSLILLPLAIRALFFREKGIANWAIPAFCVLFLYTFIRHDVIGITHAIDKKTQDVLNDPYLFANPLQTIASKIDRLDDYIKLLVFPFPLSSDYSYQTFPYSTFADPTVWLSFFIYVGLIILTIPLLIKRHPMAFALLIYLFFFATISNILFDIGATMGERLIFHSSLGFCMAIAWLLVKGVKKLKQAPQAIALTVVFILISIPAFMVTQKRNAAWVDDLSLFTTDVKTHPRSALTNGNAGSQYMNLGLGFLGHDTIIGNDTILKYGRDTVKVHHYADTAMGYLLTATSIHKKYVNGWLNLGLCYYYTEHFDKAADAWHEAYRYFPSNSILLSYQQMLLGQANVRASKKDYGNASQFFHYAAIAIPSDTKSWSDYAGSSFMAQKFTDAKDGFTQAMNQIQNQMSQLKNKGEEGSDQYKQLNNQLNGLQQGLNASAHNENALLAWTQDSTSVDNNLGLAMSYLGTYQFYPTSKRLLNKVLVMNPGNARAEKLLDSLGGLEEKEKLRAAGIK
ncbi:hypothetical protein BH09BAC5_BH09BAC5_04560 [soil metagenome]